MLYGCCVNMLPSVNHIAGIDYVKPLAEMGYDYIEIPLRLLTALDDREFEQLQRELQEYQLPCRCCNDFMPPSFQIVGDDLTPSKEIDDYLSLAFWRMEILQIPLAVFGSPWSRSCPEGFDRDRAREQIAGFLTDVGNRAGDSGVIVTIEHNNHTETNMLNHFSDTAALARDINHPHIRLMCDYYHLRVENESPDVLLPHGEMILHTHISQLEKRHYFHSLEGEEAHIFHYANVLKQIGYQGGISIEGKVPCQEVWQTQAKETLRQLRAVLG